MTLIEGLTGWGPNDRAWWDDEFWMDLTLGVLAGVLAGVVGFLLYLAGKRSEREKDLQDRREALAEEILELLVEMDGPVNDQMNKTEPDIKSLEAIRGTAMKLTRAGRLLRGTPLAALPTQIGQDVRQWTNLADWAAPTSPNRAPDLIEHAYDLSEYTEAVQYGIGKWRTGAEFSVPAPPKWEVDRRQRVADQQKRHR